MGCLSSKNLDVNSRKFPSNSNKMNLSQHEIELRIDKPLNSQSFVHSGISIKYAWASQRGYYPDALDKENQDSYSILPMIKVKDGAIDVALFGVYDGHGNDGHLAARYARNQVSKTKVISDTTATSFKTWFDSIRIFYLHLFY